MAFNYLPLSASERWSVRRLFATTISLFISIILLPGGVHGRPANGAVKHIVMVSYIDQNAQTVSIETIVRGSGPLVVMIPSLGRGAADFDDLAKQVARAGFTAAAVNPRGIGASIGPTAHEIADYARDAAEVVKALSRFPSPGSSTEGQAHRPAVLIGHAFGNRVARATAAQFPEAVARLVLLASGGQVPIPPHAFTALQAVFDAQLSPDAHIEAVRTAFFAPGNDPEIWRNGWFPDVARAQQAVFGASPPDKWTNAGSAPILIVQAVDDAVAPPANAEALQKAFPDRVEVSLLEHAGHAMLPEQPVKLARIVIGYLKREGIKSTGAKAASSAPAGH